MRVKGIVVCVNYDDLLSITLPRNIRLFSECLVVTSHSDFRTHGLVEQVEGCSLYKTDAFYRGDAKFNKGLAIEEGFDVLGRDGWIMVWDADTLLPQEVLLPEVLTVGNLYSAPRKLLENPRHWNDTMVTQASWHRIPVTRDYVFAGYMQLFHANDHHIAKRPWYDVTFNHAGGGDGYFQSRWDYSEKIYLPFNVLHLGPRDTNWFGRHSDRVDGQVIEGQEESRRTMNEFLGFKGWKPGMPLIEEFQEHVEVEGHRPSGFILKGRKDQ